MVANIRVYAIITVLIKELAPAECPLPEARTKGSCNPMAKTIIAHPAQEPQTRIDRGRELYRHHSDEITFEGGIWFVPSQHDATSVYEVILGRRGDACECKDFEYRQPEGGCLHILGRHDRQGKDSPVCRMRTALPTPRDSRGSGGPREPSVLPWGPGVHFVVRSGPRPSVMLRAIVAGLAFAGPICALSLIFPS
jgi:hypothetical protein